ncbi:MAG: NAD-binding protein [Clostridia bacterium]|nr:NAD-binding protein [Clostridia bacterium]
MNIFIIGGKREVYFLVKSFTSKGYQLTIINQDVEFCKKMSRQFKITVVNGDGSKPFILDEAGIAYADMVIALTDSDPDNLVICQIAEKIYGIKKTFAIVSDPENIKIFMQLGVETVISTSYIISSIIEQRAIVDDIKNLTHIGEGNVALMEVDVTNDNPVIGKRIHEIHFPEQAIISCIMRDGKTVIPTGKTEIMEDDHLIIISELKVQSEVLKIIKGKVD